MIKYKYKAKNKNNKIHHGVLFAKDENELREILVKDEYYLINYVRIDNESKFRLQSKIKTSDISFFCKQMSIMLSSGLDITSVIEIIIGSCTNNRLKEILTEIIRDLKQGKMLSEALNKYKRDFPQFLVNMVRIGEISGKLDILFRTLSEYYEKRRKHKQKVKSALAYPLAILTLGLLVFIFLIVKIVPIFVDIFTSFKSDIPLITTIILNFSSHIRKYFIFYLLIIILFVLISFVFRNKKRIIYFKDLMKTKLSITKKVYKAYYTVLFSEGLSVMITSGCPIVDAIDSMKKLIGNIFLENRIEEAIQKMKSGISVATSLSNINYFPNTLIEMITVGEKTGNLEEVLDIMTKYFNEEYEYTIKKLIGLIEPIMIMFIGGLIGIILLSIFCQC